jgi:hypothetical protein
MISTDSRPDSLLIHPVFGTADSVSRSNTATDDVCSWHLDRVVDEIANPEVKTIVRTVFQDLLRLLECLRLIETHLTYVDKAEQTFAFLHLMYDEARALVDFIQGDALDTESIQGDLANALDGVSFALTHDLRRISRSEASSATPPHARLSEIHRAHNILTNCLQQSTIGLAIVFDSGLVGSKLFNNSDVRYRQSLQLSQALITLCHLVELAGETGDLVAINNLNMSLDEFRNHSMEYLMYSDWPQFEGFCERISQAANDFTSVAPVLHQFQCYLETLLTQVRMRAVLAENTVSSFEMHVFEATPLKHIGPSSSSSATYPEIANEYAFAFAV